MDLMTNKEIILQALKSYKISLDLKNNYHQFETVEKIEKLINYLK